MPTQRSAQLPGKDLKKRNNLRFGVNRLYLFDSAEEFLAMRCNMYEMVRNMPFIVDGTLLVFSTLCPSTLFWPLLPAFM